MPLTFVLPSGLNIKVSVGVVIYDFTMELIIGERSPESIAVGIEAYAFSLHDIIVPGTCIAISAVPLLGSVSKLLIGPQFPS